MIDNIVTNEKFPEIVYIRDAGNFVWLKPTSNRVKRGDIVGCKSKNSGYVVTMLNNKPYRLHRLVWLFIHGEEPSDDIDHINGNRSDNRIENLRCAGLTENNRNLSRSTRNKSGFIGVCFCKKRKLWRATIGVNSKSVHIGYFETLKDACYARKQVELDLGYHVNHGRGNLSFE